MAQIDYTTKVTTISGESTELARYAGRVLLIVNTASKCGFTPQFDGLETLWKAHGEAGLTVLGFPCNQFAGQDPGPEDEIAEFCRVNYGVSFPMHGKINVNGANAHPLFEQLKAAAPGVLGTEGFKWNFTKFLVGRDGEILGRYAPKATPAEIEADIIAAL